MASSTKKPTVSTALIRIFERDQDKCWQSAFNHAFKRWTGSTPKEYRRLMRH